VVKIRDNDVVLRIGGGLPLLRRATEGGWSLVIELSFEEQQVVRKANSNQTSMPMQTLVRVSIRPRRDRDGQRPEVRNAAEQILISIRSYLMASNAADAEQGENILRRATTLVASWLSGRTE
jgi:hypothetical protein